MERLDDFEWDAAKADSNVQKHGYPFSLAPTLFAAPLRSERQIPADQTGEARYMTYAELDGNLFACVWTMRGTKRRIISLRRANKRERNAYKKAAG
ncbi:MAG: BrnT family toxin [Beijerinckiaceae bacterium]|nr:BrnT family toxin [Beijerinckiaceae bacterium]